MLYVLYTRVKEALLYEVLYWFIHRVLWGMFNRNNWSFFEFCWRLRVCKEYKNFFGRRIYIFLVGDKFIVVPSLNFFFWLKVCVLCAKNGFHPGYVTTSLILYIALISILLQIVINYTIRSNKFQAKKIWSYSG